MFGVWRRRLGVLTTGVFLIAPVAQGTLFPSGTVSASIMTSMGRDLDPDKDRSSWGLEPWLSWRPTSLSLLRLRTLLDRPFDLHRPLQIPFVEGLGIFILHQSAIGDFGLFSQSTALEIHSWSKEGFQLRQSVGAMVRLRPKANLTVELSAGPFLGATEFRKRRNGEPFSQMGFLEQLGITYQWGSVKFEVMGLAVQDWNGQWHGLYSTFERITWQALHDVSIGITHQLLRNHVDEVSGTFQPIGIFDGRKSRVAGFVQWQL